MDFRCCLVSFVSSTLQTFRGNILHGNVQNSVRKENQNIVIQSNRLPLGLHIHSVCLKLIQTHKQQQASLIFSTKLERYVFRCTQLQVIQVKKKKKANNCASLNPQWAN